MRHPPAARRTTFRRSAAASRGGWRSWPSDIRPGRWSFPPGSQAIVGRGREASRTGSIGCRHRLAPPPHDSGHPAAGRAGAARCWPGPPTRSSSGAATSSLRRIPAKLDAWSASGRRSASCSTAATCSSCSIRSTSPPSSGGPRAALLGSAAVLVANSEWTRDRCLTLLASSSSMRSADRVRVVPLGADRGVLPPGYRHARGSRAVRAGGGTMAALGRAAHAAQGDRHRAAGAGAGSATGIPTSGTPWSGTGEDQRGARGGGARARRGATGCASSPMFPTAICPRLYNCAEIYLGCLAADGAAGGGLRDLARRGVGLRRARHRGAERRHPGRRARRRDRAPGRRRAGRRGGAGARPAAGRRRAPGAPGRGRAGARSRATTTGTASPPISCASATSSAPAAKQAAG